MDYADTIVIFNEKKPTLPTSSKVDFYDQKKF